MSSMSSPVHDSFLDPPPACSAQSSAVRSLQWMRVNEGVAVTQAQSQIGSTRDECVTDAFPIEKTSCVDIWQRNSAISVPNIAASREDSLFASCMLIRTSLQLCYILNCSRTPYPPGCQLQDPIIYLTERYPALGYGNVCGLQARRDPRG